MNEFLKKLKKIDNKQIVIVGLVVLIALAAYIQYFYSPQGQAEWNDDMANVAQMGNYDSVMYEGDADVVVNEEPYATTDSDRNLGEAVTVSNETQNFFAQSKLDRESSRSMNIAALREIAQDAGADNDIKRMASEEMIMLVGLSEREMKIEALIREKGYTDVLVYLCNDGSADVIVKAPSLNSVQTAQIFDIVMRYANVNSNQVAVRNRY